MQIYKIQNNIRRSFLLCSLRFEEYGDGEYFSSIKVTSLIFQRKRFHWLRRRSGPAGNGQEVSVFPEKLY